MSTTTGAVLKTPPPSAKTMTTMATIAVDITGSKKEIVVPQDLDALSKDALVILVRDLDEERHALKSELDLLDESPLFKKRKTGISVQTTHVATTAAATAAASVVVSPAAAVVATPTAKEVTAVRKRLGKNAERVIKKMKHGNKKKPTSEVVEGGMTSAMVHEIMKGRDAYLTSDTKRLTKWVVPCNDDDDAAISNILGTDRLIHPVQFDGKVISFGGGKPKVYCWASLERMEVKYDKAQCNLTLKIKTTEFGTGSPDYKPLLLAYAKGEINSMPNSSYW